MENYNKLKADEKRMKTEYDLWLNDKKIEEDFKNQEKLRLANKIVELKKESEKYKNNKIVYDELVNEIKKLTEKLNAYNIKNIKRIKIIED